MAATPQDLDNWIMSGRMSGSRWIIVARDTEGNDDYPIYLEEDEDLRNNVVFYHGVNLQEVREVLSLEPDRLFKHLTPESVLDSK